MTAVSTVEMFCSAAIVVKATVVSRLCDVSNALLTTIQKVKSFFLNNYALFLDSQLFNTVTTKCASFVLVDRVFTERLTALKRTIMPADANREQYIAASGFLAKSIGQMLCDVVVYGRSMPQEMRSPGLNELVWQKPDGSFSYTVAGQILHNVVLANRDLIERYIELSLLQLFARIAEQIQKTQSKNVFVSLEATQEILELVTLHLEECEGVEKPKAQASSEDISEVIQMAFQLALPKGAEDFELPLPKWIEGYIKPVVFSLLKDQLLPELVREGLVAARSTLVKTIAFNEALQQVKENLESDLPEEVPACISSFAPEKLVRLKEVLNGALHAAFTYLLKNYDSILKSDSAVDKIADRAAISMVDALHKVSLQQLVRKGLERLMTLELSFVHTREVQNEQQQKKIERLQHELERMQRLVATTGDNPKRLYQILQRKLFRSSSSGAGGIFSFYGRLAQGAAKMMVEQASIKEFIGAINQAASTKLFYPEHERLYLLVTKKILQIIT